METIFLSLENKVRLLEQEIDLFLEDYKTAKTRKEKIDTAQLIQTDEIIYNNLTGHYYTERFI